MGDDDSKGSAPPKRKRKLFEKKRVTLAFKGPPLALPGAGPEGASSEPGSELGGRASATSPSAGDVSHDAWSRDRVARGSGVHRAVAPQPVDTQAEAAPESAPSGGGALDLVNRRRPSEPNLDLTAEMIERFALDDFTGALRAAELLLGREPDHSEARRYAGLCRERLDTLYSARLGSLGTVPRLAVPVTEVRWLGIDNRAGFILSRIDGKHTVDELVDISGMPRLEVLKTLIELLDAGTITIGSMRDA